MTFSVIVPIYNIEPYLEKCLESISAQTYRDYELILVDDGSLDRCPQICDEYAKKDTRVQTIHQKNGGLVSARQAGAAVASGQYIICIDGDDWIDSNYFASVEEIIGRYHPDMITLDYISEDQKEQSYFINKAHPGYYHKSKLDHMDRLSFFMKSGMFASLWSKVFIRKLYTEQQLRIDPNICMAEDYICSLAVFLHAESIYIMDKAFYHYRCTDKSITHTFRPSAFDELKLTVEFLDKITKNRNTDASGLVDEFLLRQIQDIHIKACLYANYRSLKELQESQSAQKLMSRLRHSNYRPLGRRTKAAMLMLKNGWWRPYFICYMLKLELSSIKKYCAGVLEKV